MKFVPIKFFFFVSVFHLMLHSVSAQEKLQVVSKKVEKSFTYQSGKEVIIEGEKAEIQVETWKRNEITVYLEIFARHPDKKIAEKDLTSMHFNFDDSNAKVSMRNYYASETKAQSSLGARYRIMVPEECPVKMTNYFGRSDVKNLSNTVQIRSEFSPVSLSNVQGSVDVKSRFGDVMGEWLDGHVKIESHRSNVTLKHLKGAYDIKSTFGIVKIFAEQRQVDLNIEAEKSDVYLFNPEPGLYGYELTAHYGRITSPSDLKLNFTENTDKLQHAIFSPGSKHPSVNVRITYGDIVIKGSRP